MKKILFASVLFLLSQLFYGCIAFLPPIHRAETETVVIINEPPPVIVNEPVIITEKPIIVEHSRPKSQLKKD
jgi:hypothetical protein